MERIKYLILRLLRNEISPAEQAELDSWLDEAPENRALLEDIQETETVTAAIAKLDQLHRQEAWRRVEQHAAAIRMTRAAQTTDSLLQEGKVRRMTGRRLTIAAAIAALLGTGIWWVVSTRETEPKSVVTATTRPHDVPAPANNRATLTLAGGQQVDLDSVGAGAIAQQGNMQVVKGVDGKLAYAPQGRPAVPGPSDLIYNTVTNPRGSQVVELTLSDGTRVWLNAESSIRYPVFFVGADRTVEMTGEGYFEVAKDKESPFVVNLLSAAGRKSKEKIEVLGTAFNVMGYDDEPVLRTTLVEGAVRVEANGASKKLEPGQQARLDDAGKLGLVTDPNVDKAVAWRNGNFQFDGDDIGAVMRQLARWYGVEVKYEDTPKVHYTGGISRNLNISKVLNMLALSGLHCRIDSNNTVVVLP